MASFLESGKLQLSPEEAITYRAAAARLRESSQVAIDLKVPLTIEEWMLLLLSDGKKSSSNVNYRKSSGLLTPFPPRLSTCV
jgi:hypothetical protein